jgi:hypothetical protein
MKIKPLNKQAEEKKNCVWHRRKVRFKGKVHNNGLCFALRYHGGYANNTLNSPNSLTSNSQNTSE